MQVLLTHLEPSKVMKFWAAYKLSEDDYLQTPHVETRFIASKKLTR
ncbi:MAG: hypothetical protein RMZ41_002480 [Nostoc sp. DedVER02]